MEECFPARKRAAPYHYSCSASLGLSRRSPLSKEGEGSFEMRKGERGNRVTQGKRHSLCRKNPQRSKEKEKGDVVCAILGDGKGQKVIEGKRNVLLRGKEKGGETSSTTRAA